MTIVRVMPPSFRSIVRPAARIAVWPVKKVASVLFGWLIRREALVSNRWIGEISFADWPPTKDSAGRKLLDVWKEGGPAGESSDLNGDAVVCPINGLRLHLLPPWLVHEGAGSQTSRFEK